MRYGSMRYGGHSVVPDGQQQLFSTREAQAGQSLIFIDFFSLCDADTGVQRSTNANHIYISVQFSFCPELVDTTLFGDLMGFGVAGTSTFYHGDLRRAPCWDTDVC